MEVGGRITVIHKPHQKNLKKSHVESIREILESAGVAPEAEEGDE